MKKIFFVINNSDFFASHRLNLAIEANCHGFKSVLVAPNLSNSTSKHLRNNNISFLHASFNPLNIGIINSAICSLKTFFFALKNKSAIFHLITIIPILLYGIPLRMLNRKTIFAISGFGSLFNSDKFKYKFIKFFIVKIYYFIMNGRNSKTIVQNRDDRNQLIRWGIKTDKICLIKGSGVDEGKYQFNPKPFSLYKELKILVPARLLKDKGIVEACNASLVLDQRNISHKFIFAGDIDPVNPTSLTQEEVDKLSDECPSVEFFGYVKNMKDLYNECDMVCLPTYHEGLPKSLIEAFAIGRPVITCDVTGCREIVSDKNTGMLAPSKNSDAISEAIIELSTDVNLQKNMIENAHALFLSQLTISEVNRKTMTLYRSLETVSSR